MERALVFFVNGKKIQEVKPDPEITLLTYLRINLGLTGAKLGCGEGGCGACTVMISYYDREKQKPVNFSANACLMPLCRLHGMAVTTVEGIGSTRTRLHAVQESLAKSHGTQCGFCTPGIVMSMYTLWCNNRSPSDKELEDAFQGNLCRCTGYRPILEGFRNLVRGDYCSMGENCCQNRKKTEGERCRIETTDRPCLEQSTNNCDQELIFPPELKLDTSFDNSSLQFCGKNVTWYRPTSLRELLALKKQHPNAKLVVGNTEIGIETKFKNQLYGVLICPSHIKEMNIFDCDASSMSIGASMTLATLEETLSQLVTSLSAWKNRTCRVMLDMLRWFAGQQIRNVAAVGGNIMTASPISDLNPIYMAAGAMVTVESLDRGKRTLNLDETFFHGYRCTPLMPDEVITYVTVPFTTETEYLFCYKQAHRKEDDIAIVNSAMRVRFLEGTDVVEDICLAFGGMGATTLTAKKTAAALKGHRWQDEIVDKGVQLLKTDLSLAANAPGGMAEFRKTLALSFYYKFFVTVRLELNNALGSDWTLSVPETYRSAAAPYKREASHGACVYEEPGQEQPSADAVGRSLPVLSAEKHCTGEACYVDDIPLTAGELHLAMVTSTKSHAKIVGIDPSDALQLPGVVDFICHKDVPGDNHYGPTASIDEVIFAVDKVTTFGQIIGAIVADTKAIAQKAAKCVKVTYQDLPAILTIPDAVEHKSFLAPLGGKIIRKGSTEKAMKEADVVVEGCITIGGQEHFYLETQVSLAIPKENDEMEIFSATQYPAFIQELTTKALGVPTNRITVRVKRLGGGFGGKESRSAVLLLPVVVAAYKLRRPVRCMFDRDEDMLITGGRHPFFGKYKAGALRDGTMVAAEIELLGNGGHTQDFSEAVIGRAMMHCDNCYLIPNMTVSGYMCKTNLPSNTAFRGFGAPQGMLVAECIVTDLAVHLGISPEQIQMKNLYKEGDTTHANARLTNWNLPRCWAECAVQSDIEARRSNVNNFNRAHRWKKRGLSMLPTKYAVGFSIMSMNQAGALVHIYQDGNVLVAHSGTEMGQGLHTKMLQVASRALGVDISRIYINETSTAVVPNMPPTASSSSSDLNGMAIKAACEELLRRLEPYRSTHEGSQWDAVIKAAYQDRVSLSATGFFKTPDVVIYDWEKNSGDCYPYFTYGVACTEVEIDCLTGDHQVLRTDIVMDVGLSLNPAIDIGQIEGAFVQGYGLFCLEQLKITPDGALLTRGPSTYKIPSFSNIPVEFNVSLLKGSSNPKAVYSSKGIGEPPLFLAASAFFAIKDAITSARTDSGLTGPFRLDSPATPERIRMACEDRFTGEFSSAKDIGCTPWFIQP